MKKIALITLLLAFSFASDFEKCKECISTKPITECISLKVCQTDMNKSKESAMNENYNGYDTCKAECEKKAKMLFLCNQKLNHECNIWRQQFRNQCIAEKCN